MEGVSPLGVGGGLEGDGELSQGRAGPGADICVVDTEQWAGLEACATPNTPFP